MDEQVFRMATLEAGISVLLKQLETAAADLLTLAADDPLQAHRKHYAMVVLAMVKSLDVLEQDGYLDDADLDAADDPSP